MLLHKEKRPACEYPSRNRLSRPTDRLYNHFTLEVIRHSDFLIYSTEARKHGTREALSMARAARIKHSGRALYAPTTTRAYVHLHTVPFFMPHASTRAALAGDPSTTRRNSFKAHHVTLDHCMHIRVNSPRFSLTFAVFSASGSLGLLAITALKSLFRLILKR